MKTQIEDAGRRTAGNDKIKEDKLKVEEEEKKWLKEDVKHI